MVFFANDAYTKSENLTEKNPAACIFPILKKMLEQLD